VKRPLPEAQSGLSAASDAQRLLELLHALGSTTFRQFLWQKAAELELTYAQSQVLFYVGQHSGCHMGDVAKAFSVTLPAITQIVDRLEQKKFLARGTDPTDRRVYTLELTNEGKVLVGELETLQIGGLEEVLGRMAVRNRRRVIKGLEALVAAAGEVQQEARDHPRKPING
jgi:DNA-binding MarR family transcriptional regulator